MGWPFFGRREWYALSTAFATALLSMTRRLMMRVWYWRLLLSSEGLEISPSITAPSTSPATGSISPATLVP